MLCLQEFILHSTFPLLQLVLVKEQYISIHIFPQAQNKVITPMLKMNTMICPWECES